MSIAMSRRGQPLLRTARISMTAEAQTKNRQQKDRAELVRGDRYGK